MTRALLVAIAACSTPSHPPIENRAAPRTTETFILEAPLFDTNAADAQVLWTLTRTGHTATLTITGEPTYAGTFDEHDGRLRFAMTGASGMTFDCQRRSVRAHVAGAEPQDRGEHPVCRVPRAWQPPDLVTSEVIACTVKRELPPLTTEVTMAPPPGLEAVPDDCCDDQDRCERRWEIRRLFSSAELLACNDCHCYDALVAAAARCKLPDATRRAIDQATAALVMNKLAPDEHVDPVELCRAGATFILENARSCLR